MWDAKNSPGRLLGPSSRKRGLIPSLRQPNDLRRSPVGCTKPWTNEKGGREVISLYDSKERGHTAELDGARRIPMHHLRQDLRARHPQRRSWRELTSAGEKTPAEHKEQLQERGAPGE